MTRALRNLYKYVNYPSQYYRSTSCTSWQKHRLDALVTSFQATSQFLPSGSCLRVYGVTPLHASRNASVSDQAPLCSSNSFIRVLWTTSESNFSLCALKQRKFCLFFFPSVIHQTFSWSRLETFLNQKNLSEQKPDSICKWELSPFQ